LDDLNGGMKEKLLQAILEMFTQMADKDDAQKDPHAPDLGDDSALPEDQKPGALALELDAIGKPEDKKAGIC
jgi:hypothetical protein